MIFPAVLSPMVKMMQKCVIRSGILVMSEKTDIPFDRLKMPGYRDPE